MALINHRQCTQKTRESCYTECSHKRLVCHLLLLGSKGFGMTVTNVRKMTFQFAEMNGLSHNFNSEKKWQGMVGFIHFYTKTH
jgi:hypothetical protein